MNPDQEWTETKKECDIDENGNLIPKKVTLESAKKKLLGIDTKDFFDLSVKLLGLFAIVFTGLNYVNTIHQQKKSEQQKIIDDQRQQIKDAQQTAKDRESYILQLKKDSTDNINYQREQRRLDNELRVKQIEVVNAQIESEKNFNQRQSQFEQTLENNLKMILVQKKSELEKEKSILQYRAYRNTNSEILNLLDRSVNSEGFQSAKSRLFNELYPDLLSFKDTGIIRRFQDIKHYIIYYQTLLEAYNLADSLRYYSRQIFNRLDFPRNILSRYDISKEINDTTFYFDIKYNMFAKLRQLQDKVDEMRSLKFQEKRYLAQNGTDSLEDEYYNAMHAVQEIHRVYKAYDDELHLYIQAGLGVYVFNKSKGTAENAKDRAAELGGGDWIELIPKLESKVEGIKENAKHLKSSITYMNYEMENLMMQSNELTMPSGG